MTTKGLFSLLLILSFVISSPSFAQIDGEDQGGQEPDPINISLGDKIIDAILGSKKMINQAIVELTYMRCKQFLTFPGEILSKFYVYGRGHVLLNPNWACNKSSVDLVKILDFHQEKVVEDNGQFYFIRLVFKNELIKMIQEESTGIVLKNMISNMKTEYFSLYDSVNDVLKNKEKTLRFLGVMLQDFSEHKLHYEFLLREKSRSLIPSNKIVDENMVLLEKALSRLPRISSGEMILADDGSLKERIVDFYSPRSPLNREEVPSLAYHYWVPSYVAYKLSRTKGNSDAHSYLASFSFNYFYEVLFREDLKLNSWSTIKQILSLEDTLPDSIVQAFDIYLAHEGAFYAMDYVDSKWPPGRFVKQIMERPRPAYKAAINHIRR